MPEKPLTPKNPNDLDTTNCLYEMINRKIDGLAGCRFHGLPPQIFKEIIQRTAKPTGMIVVSCPRCLPNPEGRIYGRGFAAIEEWQLQNAGKNLEYQNL